MAASISFGFTRPGPPLEEDEEDEEEDEETPKALAIALAAFCALATSDYVDVSSASV
jgi:hypothetical protein